jgi:hypothetical protein
MLEGPADEWEGGIGGSFGRHVGIGVQAVQGSKARKREVAEHVLGDQRWPEQEQRIGERDRERNRPAREHPRGKQHDRVARAHDERQHLEARGSNSQPEWVQWS